MLPHLASLLLALPLGLATSTRPASSYPTPQIIQNQQFTLIAKLTGENQLGLNPHNRVVSAVHFGAGSLVALLVSAGPLDTAAGRMYENGTTKDTSCGVGTNNVLAAGTGSIPMGVTITPQPSPSVNSAVSINNGAGTNGIGLVKDESTGVPYFVGNGKLDGQFYACNQTLYNSEPVQALFWREADTSLPDGCADIKLIPQCAGNLDNSTIYTRDLVEALCLDDAATFDDPAVSGNVNGDGQAQVPLADKA